mmetsp:Transcript_24006/g.33826  ORF Transcript_24006/g.33826 Transcript_24006/m.33826 type:complete len:249 (+) Transcript_24006:254-1000(+)
MGVRLREDTPALEFVEGRPGLEFVEGRPELEFVEGRPELRLCGALSRELREGVSVRKPTFGVAVRELAECCIFGVGCRIRDVELEVRCDKSPCGLGVMFPKPRTFFSWFLMIPSRNTNCSTANTSSVRTFGNRCFSSALVSLVPPPLDLSDANFLLCSNFCLKNAYTPSKSFSLIVLRHLLFTTSYFCLMDGPCIELVRGVCGVVIREPRFTTGRLREPSFRSDETPFTFPLRFLVLLGLRAACLMTK